MKNLKNIAVVILITLSTNLFSQTYNLTSGAIQSEESKDKYWELEKEEYDFDQVSITKSESEISLVFLKDGKEHSREVVTIIADFEQNYTYTFAMNNDKKPRVFVFYSDNKFSLEYRSEPTDKNNVLFFNR